MIEFDGSSYSINYGRIQWDRTGPVKIAHRERLSCLLSFAKSKTRTIIRSFTPIEFDLLQTEKISDFAQSFCKEHGVPDLLVNNAGCGAFFEWANFPESEIRNQINLLCTAPILMCRSFAPFMSNQKKVIVNLSSLATLYPLPFMPLI